MSKLIYNGIELPALPDWDKTTYPVAVISNVFGAGLPIYGQSPYILAIGKGTLWQSGKCYVRGIYAVYRLSNDEWVWHYGSGTVSTQDVVAANYFEAVWTNTDIPTVDGSGIYLASSAPVDPNAPEEPAPEEPTVQAPAVYRRGFMAGFLCGLSARGILGKKSVEDPGGAPITPEELPEAEEEIENQHPGTVTDDKIYFAPNGTGNTTAIGFLTDDFVITSYNYKTTEFKAIGWKKGVRIYPNSNFYGTHEYIETESPGGDYIKNIKSATVSKLYYNGEEIWPNIPGYERPEEPDTPDEPEAPIILDYYLFGTPYGISEPHLSKTVAINEGDGYSLYSGAVLPKLPEWDKEAYPYAMILHNVYGTIEFVVVSARPYYNGDSMTFPAYKYVEKRIQSDGTWGEHYRGESPGQGAFVIPFWTDFDLLAEDGSVYQPKTDPIPLVSNEPIRYEGDIPVYEKKE